MSIASTRNHDNRSQSKISRRALNRSGVLRLTTIGVAVVIQLVLLGLLIHYLRQYSAILYFALEILAFAEALMLTSNSRNPSYTIAWVIVFLLAPVFGEILYLLWGRSNTSSRKSRHMAAIFARRSLWLGHEDDPSDRLMVTYPEYGRITHYLRRQGFPLYEHCQCEYYPLGDLQFTSLIEDLRRAEQFIFLEYFIVSEGDLWAQIHEILRDKAAAGVEVRLLYDDIGSMLSSPDHFRANLRAEHIKVMAFGEAMEQLSRFYINYRNHQKIAVIDGWIGYTGGTNLADEYANFYPKHGHWKDTAIRLTGDAVWSLTVTFLEMWESESGVREDYFKYKLPLMQFLADHPIPSGNGFFQPFSDGPVNNPNNPAEMMYRQMIASARQAIFITTPYLVIDDAMMEELCLAAQSGIDVRIATPRIWDHWYVHLVTRSNYKRLIEAGVRIFEYKPGFLHAKTLLCDNAQALTGSINMDYRSFNLHYENGVWICGARILDVIRQDFLDTLAISEEVTLAQTDQVLWPMRLVQAFFRLLAPLL